jgi:Arc-like DNA binding domain
MIRNAPDMKVRLSADLRQKIERAAVRNNRTMNSEIAARLEQSFREEGSAVSPLPSTDHEERLGKIEQFVISMIFDERHDALASRVSALEKRLGEQLS